MTMVARSCCFSAAILILLGQIASCAEPWTKKPVHWSAKDVRSILTDSPWAKQGNAKFPEVIERDESAGSAQADPNAAGVGSRAGMPLPGGKIGRWDGGVGRDPGGLPTLPVLVRWDSALPVREALVHSGKADESLARSSTDYVITILGLWPGEKTKPEEEDENEVLGNVPMPPKHTVQQPVPQGAGHMRQGLIASTRLILDGQPAIVPEDVMLDKKTGAIHVFFSRNHPITLSDKEVTVATQFGPMHVIEKFRLKDMTVKGKLEL